jgi:hypothetical protein
MAGSKRFLRVKALRWPWPEPISWPRNCGAARRSFRIVKLRTEA